MGGKGGGEGLNRGLGTLVGARAAAKTLGGLEHSVCPVSLRASAPYKQEEREE